jgi:hypothetical protein
MIMKRIFIVLLLLAVTFSLYAQYGEPVAILEYYDDDLELEITGSDGFVLTDIYYGMDLQEGDTIRTMRTGAEIRLDPNGSIIKLSQNTVFTIDALQKSAEESNNFSLVSGKIRAIAAKAGIGEKYQVMTQSAVCGIRGTDFGVISIPGSEEKAFVVDGLIDYTNSLTNQKIELGAGMIGDTFADIFQAVVASAEQMTELVKDVVFEQLDPTVVPGHTQESTEEVVEETEEEIVSTDVSAAPPEDETTELEGTEEATEEESIEEQVESEIMNYLSDLLGLEIGTVTIEGKTYSKAIIQPTFSLGKLKMSLYLPIVYETDMFDPDDWYKPEGNHEWSFGTDESFADDDQVVEWKGRIGDILDDLFLKIRYVQWGEQRDPFFFKFGNVNNMTLGHGILMNNYANDADFPAVRRLGLNLGMEGKKIGLEAVANDLPVPEIFGTRIYLKPFGKLALGVSSVVDIDPDGNDVYNDTVFITAAADIDFPIMENDVLSFIFFADIAGMVPYMSAAGDSSPSFRTDMLYDDVTDSGFSMSNFRNFGWNAGLFGNILFVDYRFEYRYFDGVFKPSFFGTSYERLRSVYIDDINTYLDNPSVHPDYDSTVMGIYGEAGFSLFEKINATLGYMWPWSIEDGASDEDEILFELEILPGTIPVLDIYGSIAYHRTKFIPTLLNRDSAADLDLFDEYTTVSGELIYPLAPTLDLAAVVSTTLQTNEDGTIYYDGDGNLKMVPVITIETRIGF